VAISQDILLDLMQVSHLWSNEISSSAVDIILEDKHDAAAKAAMALQYSQQAPLGLHMYYPTGMWDVLREQLFANRALVTRPYVHNEYPLPSFITPILRQLSPLSCLVYLYYDWMAYAQQMESFSYLLDSPLQWANLWLDRDTLARLVIWEF
jgi:hypothetical protein